MEKMLNLGKIVLLITFFVMKLFLTIVSYQFFKNYWIFIKHGLFFRAKYSLQLYHFHF